MTYRRAPGVLHQEVDGLVVLITAAGDELIDLNDTGSIVWRSLDGGADVAALVAAVRAVHPDAAEDAVTRDVEAFLAELAGSALVVSD